MMAFESAESDKEYFFGPFSKSLNMHKYAVDNDDSVLDFADITNGFVMEIAANCLKYVDAVYVIARLVREDILQDDKKRLESIVSKVRLMYNTTKDVVKKCKKKQKRQKELLQEPFTLPSFKGSTVSGTPSSSRSNTPSNQTRTNNGQASDSRSNTPSNLARTNNGQASNGTSNNSRRVSVESSIASMEEGNGWDPNADEQGNECYFMQQDEEERPMSSKEYNIQRHLARIQETEWILPDHKLPAEVLRPMLTCGLCKGYLFNAVTVIVCGHFFCKSCIVKHICNSLHCPTCSEEIHPTDPTVNLRLDIVLQDIVNRILPDVEKEEVEKEKKFYKDQNLPYPKAAKIPLTHNLYQERPYKCLMSVVLEYKGTTDPKWTIDPLLKCYMRLPELTKMEHLLRVLHRKLRLSDKQEVYLFVDGFMLHKKLTLAQVWDLLFTDELDEPHLVILQYAVMSTRDHWSKLLKPTQSRMNIEEHVKI